MCVIISTENMLYIVATPIGNLEDITLRALRVLGEVDVLACEDTRRTRKLYERHGIRSPGKIISYREDNEKNAVNGIIKLLEEGKNVAVCSDAGYPGISDPGYRLISAAIEKGIEIQIIPGAGAVELALLYSGLPTNSFTFRGFPPKKRGQLLKFLEKDRESEYTLIYYESPYRLEKFLVAALEIFGDRRAAVCIEMTKKFERISRGNLSGLVEEFEGKEVKGEVCVVVGNPDY